MQTAKIIAGTTVIISFSTSGVGAQGLVEAMQTPVPFDPPYSSGVVSYQTDGTEGWSFIPSQMIKVDALGCILGNTFMTAGVGRTVEGGWNFTASTIYTNSPQINTSQYEPITPVFLNPRLPLILLLACAATNDWIICGTGSPMMAAGRGLMPTHTLQSVLALPFPPMLRQARLVNSLWWPILNSNRHRN